MILKVDLFHFVNYFFLNHFLLVLRILENELDIRIQ